MHVREGIVEEKVRTNCFVAFTVSEMRSCAALHLCVMCALDGGAAA